MKKAIVIQAHNSKFLNPLILAKGDKVKTGEEDDEFPGWVWYDTEAGLSGFVEKV